MYSRPILNPGRQMITNVYIDGFNLFYGALKGTPYKWLDLEALCCRLLPNDDIHRVRYFTARVTARPQDRAQPERQQAYLQALATLPKVTVHEGEFFVSLRTMRKYDPDAPPHQPIEFVTVIKTEEKGSDVNLATYLMLDACRKDSEAVVVVTNDSDLKEPIRIARDELGLVTGIVNPHPSRHKSRGLEATFFKQLRRSMLAQCQFPDVVGHTAGREILKPKGW
jgi:hypothetical protein